jgi:hypothetical protein
MTDAARKPRRRWAAPALVCLPVVAMAASNLGLLGPAPKSDAAPAAEFSAARALVHLRAVASEPHGVGTADHERVFQYLASALRAAGLEVEVQEGERRGVAIKNILARLPGAASTGEALFACHYDSAAGAPGAADDGAAVAGFLEAIRALRSAAPLRNDLYFLFTDGEELGLVGAALFVDEHPKARDFDVVFNFEARGNSGPSILFETSPENGRLIAEYATAVAHPVASSLGPAVYRLLPNDTDFTELRRAGLRGLNLAFIDGVGAYHTPGDTVENLGLRSLQHHGDIALALARRFGDIELSGLDREEAEFFSLPWRRLASYPKRWALWIAAGALALTVVLAGMGAQAGVLSLKGFFRGLERYAMVAVGIPLLNAAAWFFVDLARKALLPPPSPPRGELWGGHVAVLGMGLISALLGARMLRGRLAGGAEERWRRAFEVEVGAAAFWLVLLLPWSCFGIAGSYLIAWPLLGYAAAAIVDGALGRRPGFELVRAALHLAASVPGVIVLSPAIYLIFLAFLPAPLTAVIAASFFSSLLVLPMQRWRMASRWEP